MSARMPDKSHLGQRTHRRITVPQLPHYRMSRRLASSPRYRHSSLWLRPMPTRLPPQPSRPTDPHRGISRLRANALTRLRRHRIDDRRRIPSDIPWLSHQTHQTLRSAPQPYQTPSLKTMPIRANFCPFNPRRISGKSGNWLF